MPGLQLDEDRPFPAFRITGSVIDFLSCKDTLFIDPFYARLLPCAPAGAKVLMLLRPWMYLQTLSISFGQFYCC
jgi:hypothetical protein